MARQGRARRGVAGHGKTRQATHTLTSEIEMKEANENKRLVDAEIHRLSELNGGEITARRLVDEASNPVSVLHRCFEWDNDAAGDKYRLVQARALIRSCRVIVHTSTKRISSVAYVRDPGSEEHTSELQSQR